MAHTSSDGVRQGWGAEKSRVVTWRDPPPTAAIAASMDGWEFVQAVMDHRLPIEEESPVRVCMQQTGQTRWRCREDIRRSDGLP